MTLRPFLSFLAAFMLLYFYLIVSVIAAPKWKDEVGIAAWCYDLKVIQAIVEADADGNPDVGDALATKAFNDGTCARLPLPVATFKPTGIAARFPDFGGRPVTVIKGNLVMKDESLGREVYVLVPDHLLSGFQIGEPAKTLPGLKFDRDEGWQDV